MSKATRAVAMFVGLVAVSFAIHYALFGSLPLGKPKMLGDDGETNDEKAEANVAQ